jgi:polysaccharide pyruvyl transferase WcaK-like protein
MIYSAENSIPKILLVGYNGANNTGSESRLLSIIDDIREILGPDALITVPTLNEKNLRRYIKEEKTLRIKPVPSIFFFSIKKLVRQHDLILLVEGSCYMDNWTSALLWAFLWTTKYAYALNKPIIAYAVDTGQLNKKNQKRVKKQASKTDLIITRTNNAAELLKFYGVKTKIKVTADTSFTFHVEKKDENLLFELWPESQKNGVIGFAVVDFYLWPVIVRPFGRAKNCYKWPYYFKRSKDRITKSIYIAKAWADEADRIIEKSGKSVALICMEQLDEPLAINIRDSMINKQNVKIFSSKQYNASQMTSILRKLDILITSRYHAAVLSLAAKIPMVAIGHDTRLHTLFNDLDLSGSYFFNYKCKGIWEKLSRCIDTLIKKPWIQKQKLIDGYQKHSEVAKKNKMLLKQFLIKKGWKI